MKKKEKRDYNNRFEDRGRIVGGIQTTNDNLSPKER